MFFSTATCSLEFLFSFDRSSKECPGDWIYNQNSSLFPCLGILCCNHCSHSNNLAPCLVLCALDLYKRVYKASTDFIIRCFGKSCVCRACLEPKIVFGERWLPINHTNYLIITLLLISPISPISLNRTQDRTEITMTIAKNCHHYPTFHINFLPRDFKLPHNKLR
jgi:hypothetical protein